MCGCKKTLNGIDENYAKLAANTGMVLVNSANPSLDGTGNIFSVITGAGNGTYIRSVRIKAIEPVIQGMVRLFVSDGVTTALFKEIPVATSPTLAATPTPNPVLQTFEITLGGGFKLENGSVLYASSQILQNFNVIAEGLDWEYPLQIPTLCCNFKNESAITGVAKISVANTNLDGSGTIGTVFTTPQTNGALIKTVTIKALQSTNEGMVRLFISDGVTNFLLKEVSIPQTNQSAFEPAYKYVIDDNIYLKAGYLLKASTQLNESFAITVEAVDWTYA